MYEGISQKNFTHSNVFACSPSKLTLDLQEARRQYRSRNRSIENIQCQKFNKDRICKDVYDLQSTWNELQYQRKRQSIMNTSKERSISNQLNTLQRDISPEHSKGIQLASRIQAIGAHTPLRGPHRTQIYLPSNKVSQVLREEEQIKIVDTPTEKPTRKGRNISTSAINDKPFQYFNKVFNSCVNSNSNGIDFTPKKQRKYHIGHPINHSIDRQKYTREDVSSPNRYIKLDTKYRYDMKEAVAKQIKKLRIRKANQTKDSVTDNSMGRLSIKLFDSNMEIESILFQKNTSKLY